MHVDTFEKIKADALLTEEFEREQEKALESIPIHGPECPSCGFEDTKWKVWNWVHYFECPICGELVGENGEAAESIYDAAAF